MSILKKTSILLFLIGLGGCSTPPVNPDATSTNQGELSGVDSAPGLEGDRLGDDAQVKIGGVSEDGIASLEIGGESSSMDQALELNQAFDPVIYFEYDQFDLSAEGLMKVQYFAEILNNNPQRQVILEGHTDERGSPEYNLALGEKRAKAVQDALLSLGVEVTRIEANSYGEEYPVAFDKTEEAWRLNRRVEITIR